MKNSIRLFPAISLLLLGWASFSFPEEALDPTGQWLLIDDFETGALSNDWGRVDPDNQTEPYVENPQITEVRAAGDTEEINSEPRAGADTENHYLIKKPAAEGVIGNRKALTYMQLPKSVAVGETYTFYTRVNVEYFPNNHSFGLSNLSAEGIEQETYNAFEPMIRITDKYESNGYKNDGTLMVMVDEKAYRKIINPDTGLPAKPMSTDTWYELWYVVNNAEREGEGQRYDLYIRGGEFEYQKKVFTDADFRIQREMPLTHFIAISNTGSVKKPYGNGGVRYDDIYMAEGRLLSTP